MIQRLKLLEGKEGIRLLFRVPAFGDGFTEGTGMLAVESALESRREGSSFQEGRSLPLPVTVSLLPQSIDNAVLGERIATRVSGLFSSAGACGHG